MNRVDNVLLSKTLNQMKSIGVCFHFYKFLCIFATVFMVGYWLFRYGKNYDATLIEFKLLNDTDDLIYPEMTLCFYHPFLRNERFNITKDKWKWKYVEYLRRLEHNETFKDIKYEQVTPDLNDYFEEVRFTWKSGEQPENFTCFLKDNCPYYTIRNNYNGFSPEWRFLKCFGINIVRHYAKNIVTARFIFNESLQNAIRQVQMLQVSFNHPNQFTRPRSGLKQIWPKTLAKGKWNVVEIFQITSLEVLKRRNKPKEPCTDEWNSFDQLVLKKHLESVGCRTPYISQYPAFPICNTKTEAKKAYFNGWSLQKYYTNDPCQEMPTIDYTRQTTPVRTQNIKTYNLWVSYPFKGKIITQQREVDAQTLVGNIGGYIGLFLGKLSLYFITTHCYFYERFVYSCHV